MTEWTLAADLLGRLDATVRQFVVPIFVMAFSVYGNLFRYLKTSHVLIRVGKDDSIAWPEIPVLTLPKRS